MTLAQKALLARWTTLLGYFGLMTLLLNWFIWISPPTEIPRAFLLIVMVVPLLFPLRGILHARTYTHSWVSFLSLFYFAIGVDVAFNQPLQRTLGMIMLVLSLLLFFGSVYFAYYEKRRIHSTALSAE